MYPQLSQVGSEQSSNKSKLEKLGVKNSLKDMVMGGNESIKEESTYVSRKQRLEEGNKY